MKRKLLIMVGVILLVVGGVVGCGKEAPAAPAAPEVQEAAVEETVSEAEVPAVEETVSEAEVPAVEETVSEAEVVDPVAEYNLERPDITYGCIFVVVPQDIGYIENMLVNSNDYIDYEAMAELASRGYDLDGFIIAYTPFLNEARKLEDCTSTVILPGREDELFLLPVLINLNKANENCRYNITMRNIVDNQAIRICEPADGDFSGLDRIFNEIIPVMKEDPNYEEINFKNLDSELNSEIIKSYVLNRERNKEYTYSDYLNAIIYDKFVTGDSDFTGIING